ncbi:MAG: hypothetical protein HKN59_06345 [Gammaproteobacteria bacterium]|nr:hypothetical protein [Gammaproteobacteria bacterium]
MTTDKSWVPRVYIALALLTNLATSAADAEPALWETDYGAMMSSLTGTDDAADNVVLSFEFPFAEQTYTVASVNVNGGVVLGNDPGEFHTVPWHLWHRNSFVLGFSASGNPSLVPFNTDLDLTSTGQIYFKDFGDRAVFTWDGAGSNRSPNLNFATFQLQIFADGKFSFAYQDFNGDLIADLDEGIVVGFSDGSAVPPAGSVDFSDAPFSGLTTSYEIWCYDEDPGADPAESDCYEPGRDNNSAFDVMLADGTLEFMPDGTGGFLVTNQAEASEPPPPPPLPDPTTGEGGSGGAGIWMLFLIAGAAFRARLKNQTPFD